MKAKWDVMQVVSSARSLWRNRILMPALYAITLVSSGFLSAYLRIEPYMVGLFVLGALGIASVSKIRNEGGLLTRRTMLLLLLFSTLLDLSLILGFHVVQSGSGYTGLIDENYISDYSLVDAIAFAFMLEILMVMAAALLCLMKKPAADHPGKLGSDVVVFPGVISPKMTIVCISALFAAWVPYLAIYYPGFIFSDTMASVMQIEGLSAFSNHHPLAYTLFLGFCVKMTSFFGLGMAAGCGLCCIIQMLLLSGAIGYLISWIIGRLCLKGAVKWVSLLLLLLYFGASPYFASFSIALWKDPLFSAAMVVVTLHLADLVLQPASCLMLFSVSRNAMFAIAALCMLFFRNNGVYIMLLVGVALFVVVLKLRGGKDHRCIRAKRSLLISVSVIFIFVVVSGPVFKLAGVSPSPSSESLGIPLNQMARVAASDGVMTEEDRAYLDSILPYELYPTTYRPCCVDLLKWNEHFNAGNVGQGFFGHWLSMLVRNPVVYFESWELQTFGYWAINQPTFYLYDNIMAGDPQNGREQAAAFGVDPLAGIQSEVVRAAFPHTGFSVSIGLLLWVMLLLAIAIIDAGRASWLLILVPSMGLIATLFVASPIWYWPRYAAAVQMLLPLYIALFYLCGCFSCGNNDLDEADGASSAMSKGS